MGNTLKPLPDRILNNPADKIGQKIQFPTGVCGRVDNATARNLLPSNGEYTETVISLSDLVDPTISRTKCAACINCDPREFEKNNGTCDGSGHCAVGDFRPFYTRKAFSADKDQCCLTEAKLIGDKTCNPLFNAGPTKPDCDSTFQVFCSNPSNMPNPLCQTWCKLNPGVCNVALQQFCQGENVTSPTCINFCQANPSDCTSNLIDFCQGSNLNTAKCIQFCQSPLNNCDQVLKTFCSSPEQVNNPICACFKSDEFYNNFRSSLIEKLGGVDIIGQSDPTCFFPPCASRSVIPSKHKTQLLCANVVNCIQVVDVDVSGTINSEAGITFKQDNKCQGFAQPPPTPPTPPAPPAPPAPPTPPFEPKKEGADVLSQFKDEQNKQLIGVGVGVGVLAIVGFSLAMYFLTSKKK
jgi:hypothetical protein